MIRTKERPIAKVKITGIPELEKRIEETFGKVRESRQMRTEVGEFLVERIKGEARRGKPLNDDRSFPELRSVTQIIREDLAQQNATHPTFKVERSNITFTGQLVDSLRYLLLDKKIVIEVPNTRRRKLKSKGVIVESQIGIRPALTNKEVDRNLRRLGFDFYTAEGIESEERVLRRINNILKKFVRRAIKINFGK